MTSNPRFRRLLGAALGLVMIVGMAIAWSPVPRAAAGEMNCNTALNAWGQTVAAWNECRESYSESVCDASIPLDHAWSQVEVYCDFSFE